MEFAPIASSQPIDSGEAILAILSMVFLFRGQDARVTNYFKQSTKSNATADKDNLPFCIPFHG